MITSHSRTKEWIEEVRGRLDSGLTEKMILAFTLVEAVEASGLNFIFKGGTSIPLITGRLKRFSIDIDIMTSPGHDIEPYLRNIIDQGVFTRFESDIREGNLPTRHYKFYYPSVYGQERYVLLDVLYEEPVYEKTINVEITSSILNLDGAPTTLRCPVPECLLGDKLTAFAPHTTGIQYNVAKELEIAKQLYDIATLFDIVEDIKLVFGTYELVTKVELGYRNMYMKTVKDVASDTFDTSCMIGLHDQMGLDKEHKEYNELVSGFSKLRGYVYSELFSPDAAILCASKAAYLAALYLTNQSVINRYQKGMDLFSLQIGNPELNKLNKLKKTNIEAFYYFYHALNILDLL